MSQADIDDSKAPLLDHLIELRQKLLYSIIFLVGAAIVCFIFSEQIYQFLAQPLHNACLAQDGDASKGCRLIITAPQEAFFTYLKLSLFGGFCLAFPLIANQLWAFVAPGLYRHEKSAFLPFIAATPVLFLLGASLVYYMIMPMALSFFYAFTTVGVDGGIAIELETKVSEYFSLVMTLILAFGLCFQLPVLLVLLARVGMTSAKGLREKRKYAIVGIFLAAAVLTPPDPLSQIGLGLAIMALYEISILMVVRVEKKRATEKADADEDEDEDEE